MHHQIATMKGEISHLRQISGEAQEENTKLASEKQQLTLDLNVSASETRSLNEKVSPLTLFEKRRGGLRDRCVRWKASWRCRRRELQI